METREQIVGKLMDEQERLQYDDKDSQRIYDIAEKVTKSFIRLLDVTAEFRNEIESEVDEDADARMADIRMNLVTAHANALVNLYKLGGVFRISGEGFDRLTEYLSGPEDAPLVMAGL